MSSAVKRRRPVLDVLAPCSSHLLGRQQIGRRSSVNAMLGAGARGLVERMCVCDAQYRSARDSPTQFHVGRSVRLAGRAADWRIRSKPSLSNARPPVSAFRASSKTWLARWACRQ